MGKIATLIYHCANCNTFFTTPGKCPVCHAELEDNALINAYELQKLIAKLNTPEGIVNLLKSFEEWVNR